MLKRFDRAYRIFSPRDRRSSNRDSNAYGNFRQLEAHPNPLSNKKEDYALAYVTPLLPTSMELIYPVTEIRKIIP